MTRVDPARRLTEWKAQVREPAKKSAEGVRTLAAALSRATASYDLAPLPCGSWAVRFSLVYNCGTFGGHTAPWTRFPTRRACLAYFLDEARSFFGQRVTQPIQHRPRDEMNSLLSPHHSAFTEPKPFPPPSRTCAA